MTMSALTLTSRLPRFGQSKIGNQKSRIRTCLLPTAYCLLVLYALPARAQVATGTPPFGSFSGGPDVVNNANLNVHWAFPVTSKAGRGLPFSYALGYDNSIWYPQGGAWTLVSTSKSGWQDVVQSIVGYVTYSHTGAVCRLDNQTYNKYSAWRYHDRLGTSHLFALTISDASVLTICTNGVPAYSGTATASDGSGYTISVDAGDGTGPDPATVQNPSGWSIYPPYKSGSSSASFSDTNGNTISASTSSNTTTFTDTLGTTALTVSAPAPPASTTYTVGSGPATFTVNYSSYTVETNFGCSGITDFGQATRMTEYLVSSIQLPDQTSYVFTYENTPTTPVPTYPNQIFSNAVTGRIASITLPTGGKISYSYTGGSNGITCGDGSTATLTRTVNDNNGNNGAWTYAHTESGTAWTTTVTDPNSKVTTIHFQGMYETSRTLPDSLGSSTACYNGNTANCDTTAVTLPITERLVTSTLGNATSKLDSFYNTYGLPTRIDEYNWGPTFARETMTCYATLSNPYVLDRPSAVLVYSATGNPSDCSGTTGLAAKSAFAYDGNGNLQTETHVNTNGSPSSISRSFIYSTSAPYGVLQSATDFNGHQTDYTNNGCNSSFPTTITLPSPFNFTRTITYDTGCNGAVPTSVKDDQNNATTGFQYSDPFWRPTEVDYPDNGKTTYGYPNPNTLNASVLVTGSTYHSATQTLDGLGRVVHSQDNSVPGGSTVDTTYNSLGQVYGVSNPHGSSGSSSDGTTYYSYDALGRLSDVGATKAIQRPDGNKVSVVYSGNCTTVADEQGNARQSCMDGLGRTNSVTDASGTTNYTYDVLNNLTRVSQGGQTRTYNYDMLSRLTSAAVPESGATSFTYDANGNVLTRTDARGITTCFGTWNGSSCATGYDALNRPSKKTYSDGTPTANFYYDETSVTIGSWTSPTLTNPKGRLTHTTAMNGSTLLAETVNSYDTMGRPNAYYQCTPQTCPSSTLVTSTYSYDLAGDLTSQLLPAVSPLAVTITNTIINSAQQITQMTSNYVDSAHPATLGSFTYTPFGALSTITDGCVGSGCTPNVETYTYNNRLQPVMIQVGRQGGNLFAYDCTVYNYYSGVGNPSSCAAPSQGSSGNNGNVMGYYFQDSANSSLSHTAAYGYDSLNRLTSAQATGSSTYSLGFSFDQWGNVTCTGGAGGGSANGPCASIGYNTGTNRISTIAGSSTGISYDAAGDLLQDGTGIGAHAYTWDGEGRLTSVASPPGTTIASYVYNALGQRVEKSGSGTGGWAPFDQLYDAFGNYLTLIEGSNSNQKCYLPPVGGRLFGEYAGSGTAYLHTNLLGSTGTVIDAANNVLQDEIFYPWGQLWASYGNLSYNENYAAMRQRDWESGLDPTDFRMYTSQYGRWLSPDPLAGDITNPQSLNRYAYVLNSPTRFTDPSGAFVQACNPDAPGTCNWGVPGLGQTGPGGGGAGGYFTGPLWANEAQDEAQYNGQVAANWLLQQGIQPGLDKNGTLYIWMPGSQVCSSQDGTPVGCSAATQGSWVKFSDLPSQVQNYYSIMLSGSMSSSWANGTTFGVWGAAYLAPLAVTGYEGLYALAVTYPTEFWWATQFAQGALTSGATTSPWAAAGRVAKAGWNWLFGH